ncbi:uncharacterized protein LOC131662924 isoform X1 [Phymastichus coffea]|uniref:uncharacterized protein LOC131662924 isoform X1 n=1 Tax=Phymastichus coffea TaxID=108790 RepID=UPI00273BC35D|nr:uncharacterized protein LOC131662924 isoform X1 [Phymastichus coffea]
MDAIVLTPSKMPRTTTSVEVLQPLFNDTNGDIEFYAIIVSRLGFGYKRAHRRFDLRDEDAWPDTSSWKETVEKDLKIAYHVTEPRWIPYLNYIVNYVSVKAVKYVIGEDVACRALIIDNRLYCNGPLKPGTTYQVWMRAIATNGYADADYVLVITGLHSAQTAEFETKSRLERRNQRQPINFNLSGCESTSAPISTRRCVD